MDAANETVQKESSNETRNSEPTAKSTGVPNTATSSNPNTNQNPIQNTVKNNPTTPTREANRKKKTFKIIVIGDTGVGKTCLTYRFCSGKFPSTPTDATIGVDFREKLITLDNNEQVRLQLWDTAGQERFRRSMVAHYYRNVAAVVLVYDVTRQSTFDALAHWIEECTNHNLHPDNVPMLIVGNKCDGNNEDVIVVSTNIAQIFADSYNMPLFETSAKSDEKCDHVEAIFLTLAHKVNANKLLFKNREEQESNSSGNTVQVNATSTIEEESGYCCF